MPFKTALFTRLKVPEVDAVVTSLAGTGQNLAAVRRKGRVVSVTRLSESPQFLPGCHIPQAHGSIGRRSQNSALIGGVDRAPDDVRVPLEPPHLADLLL